MPWSPSAIVSRLRSWLRDYDRIQSLAVLLLYVQIACALVGSLGASYNGVLLVDLVVSLFALVAIESGNQTLGRTYAVLLVCAILLDVVWFTFFFHSLWNASSEDGFFVFSLRLALWMQVLGFSVRSLSSLLWIQVYRLGVSGVDSAAYAEAGYDLRSSFINPPVHQPVREYSISDELVGGSIYDPAYYSSLFEESQTCRHIHEDHRQDVDHNDGSASRVEDPQLRSCVGKSFQIINIDREPDNNVDMEHSISPESSRL